MTYLIVKLVKFVCCFFFHLVYLVIVAFSTTTVVNISAWALRDGQAEVGLGGLVKYPDSISHKRSPI